MIFFLEKLWAPDISEPLDFVHPLYMVVTTLQRRQVNLETKCNKMLHSYDTEFAYY